MRNSFVFPASVEKSTTPIPALSKSYNHYPVTENRNASGRFFSFNTNRQALDVRYLRFVFNILKYYTWKYHHIQSEISAGQK